tara:strand:+ start:2681 stop:3463 length:783 start_codon:yes stop_codon:yes gene_type:complete
MPETDTPLTKDLTQMRAFLGTLVDQCHQRVWEGQDDYLSGYAYLRSRGVTDAQIDLFKIGVGPSEKVWPPYDIKDGVNSTKFREQFKGTLEGQLVFPVYNTRGTLRGIETRRWYDTKYRKYTQYFLSDWKLDAVFLGLPQALPSIWESETVYLVEGMFDFFVVQRVFPNTLCTLTARVSWEQQRFLKRWCRNIVFLFDSDQKGREAAQKARERYNTDDSELLAHQIMVPAKDPSEYYKQAGFERFARYLRQQSRSLNLYL